MLTLYKILCKNVTFFFLKIVLQSPKYYSTLNVEEYLTSTIFVRFSFLQLCNIWRTYFEYFQNNVSQTDISSAAQASTTGCYFSGI